MPLYGHELSEEIHPFEAGLAYAVDLENRSFPGSKALAKLRDDKNYPERVGWQLEGDTASSSRSNAERNDYNRNLVDVLRHHERNGRLTVEVARPNVVGVNPRNATSLVQWRATR